MTGKSEDDMEWDAVLLAGGRATRMGGIDKTALLVGGESLLEYAVRAASQSANLSIVGLRPERVAPPRAVLAREDPPFSGPASAIAAGLDAVRAAGAPAAMTLVLACDLPRVEEAVAALLQAVECRCPGHSGSRADADGFIALDGDQRRQPLLALYRTAPLQAALASHRRDGTLDNLSLHRLLSVLDLVEIPLSTALTADLDSPEDAVRVGARVAPPPPPAPNG